MKNLLTKRNLFIGLFTVLYLAVAVVSLIHSFEFFGLANSRPMAVMLGCCFEIGQMAVLLAILTGRNVKIMPWILMGTLTLIQILGNVFSSYKYLINHSTDNLRYFKEPIFIWTDLPDNQTTVIITYIVGGILPVVTLFLVGMVEQYLKTEDQDQPVLSAAAEDFADKKAITEPEVLSDEALETLTDANQSEHVFTPEDVKEVNDKLIEKKEEQTKEKSHFINLDK